LTIPSYSLLALLTVAYANLFRLTARMHVQATLCVCVCSGGVDSFVLYIAEAAMATTCQTNNNGAVRGAAPR
jgi:phosphoserine phosphatase